VTPDSRQIRVGAIVQARMSSQRLPGKVLTPLAGRPALDWLLERLDHARSLDAIVVATSEDPSDDAVATFCARRGVACHRGPLDDVAGRVLGAARANDLDGFARVSGDSPLLDQRLVDHGVELFRASRVDLVTNVRPRTFPPGQSVEVVRTATLAGVYEAAGSSDDREHVTGPLYEGGFRVVRFEADSPRTSPSLTLDTSDDRERLERCLAGFDRPHHLVGWEECLAAATRDG
jgi:spore coat polysaccharide biosynthesis protein SpsF